ncbi:MAG: hypothetical protein ACO3XN_08040, partial [Chthoniobacterales bacterium]
MRFQASSGLARVWTKGNPVSDTGSLRGKVNIFMGMLPRFVENLLSVSNEDHVFNFFEVFFSDEEIIYFCCDAAYKVLNCFIARRLRGVKLQSACRFFLVNT